MCCFDNWDEKNPIIPRSNQINDWEKYYIDYISDNVIAIDACTQISHFVNVVVLED